MIARLAIAVHIVNSDLVRLPCDKLDLSFDAPAPLVAFVENLRSIDPEPQDAVAIAVQRISA